MPRTARSPLPAARFTHPATTSLVRPYAARTTPASASPIELGLQVVHEHGEIQADSAPEGHLG